MTERITTSSAVRAPQITRESDVEELVGRCRSRWCELGVAELRELARRGPTDWAKPYGASHGAKIAQTTKTAVISTPATSIQRARPVVLGERAWRGSRASPIASVPHPRVDQRVDDVDQQADQHHAMAKNVTIPCTAP